VSPPLDPLIIQQFWVRVAISFCVLACALFVILSKRYTPTQKHWAYATLGTLLGYWLKL
jgi:hypothetical protein